MGTLTKTADIAEADFESLQQAADWFATLNAGDATDDDRAGWEHWQQLRPQNLRAWHHIEAVSRRFQPLRNEGEQEAALAGLKSAHKNTLSTLSRRKLLQNGTALAGAGLLAWLGWQHTALPETLRMATADFRTAIGETRAITLADGSQVWLNTDTALNVGYSTGRRRLELIAGEILIETAHDVQQRPFTVDTRFGRLLALGTRFTVRTLPQTSYLAVYQGAVQIRTNLGQMQIVDAGGQTQYSASHIDAVENADRARQAWARGVLLADNLRLADLVSELARYRRAHIAVAPAVANIKVMGAYPTADPDLALSMLEQSLPVRVHRILPWWISVEARQ